MNFSWGLVLLALLLSFVFTACSGAPPHNSCPTQDDELETLPLREEWLVRVARRLYYSGPEGNSAYCVSWKFNSFEDMVQNLWLGAPIGRFHSEECLAGKCVDPGCAATEWRLGDILVSMYLNANGYCPSIIVSGPKPLVDAYVGRLSAEEETGRDLMWYDFSCSPIKVETFNGREKKCSGIPLHPWYTTEMAEGEDLPLVVADRLYRPGPGPDENSAYCLSWKFKSREDMVQALRLDTPIGRFHGEKCFDSECVNSGCTAAEWSLFDILVLMDLNADSNCARLIVSGPQPLVDGYVSRLAAEEASGRELTWYDFSCQPIEVVSTERGGVEEE